MWDIMENNPTNKDYIKIFDRNWETVGNATSDDFNKLTKSVCLLPDDQFAINEMFKIDKEFFKASVVSPNLWFVRCGVLLTDTLVQIRLKIFSVTGWNIFCQHLFFVNEYKDGFGSDILLIYENGDTFYANPFEELDKTNFKGTKHDFNVRPCSNVMYLLLAQDMPISKQNMFKILSAVSN